VSDPSDGSSSASRTSVATTPRPKGKKRAPKAPSEPGVARIIAIANQKGGVGKSTTAVSLGAALAERGYRVLVIDLDPQGNASTGIGIRHEDRRVTSYDVIVSEAPIESAVVHSTVAGLDAVPSTIDLAGAEIELVSQFSREARLKKALGPVHEGVYDFIFLDCPPSLGLITVNALTAAEELLVPIQCEYYALEGLGQLLRNVSLVQQNINAELRLTGIVMTMFDPRTKLSEQVVEEVQRYFGALVYDTIIPRTVRLSEAPGYGAPITVYDPKSKGAESYRSLAAEVAARPAPKAPMPSVEDLTVVVKPQIVDEPVSTAKGEDADPEDEPPGPDEIEDDEPEALVAVEEREPEQPEAQEAQPVAPPPVSQERGVDFDRAPSDDAAGVETASPPTGAEDVNWDPRDETPRVRPVRGDPGHLPERRVVVIDEDADASEGRAAAPGTATEDETIGATLHDDTPKRRWRLFRKGGE
jgi:chromosome partitioning protein